MTPQELRSIAPKDDSTEVAQRVESRRGASSPSKKNKTDVACENCRLRKKKCNGAKPTCSNCIGQTVVCTYPTRAQGPASEVRDLKSLLLLMQGLLFAVAELNDRTAATQIVAQLREQNTTGASISLENLRVLILSEVRAHTLPIDLFSAQAQEILADEVTTQSAQQKFTDSLASTIQWTGELETWSQSSSSHQLQNTSIESSHAKHQQGNIVSEEPMILGGEITPSYSGRFGNLSLSSGIRANYYQQVVQNTQIQNLSTSNWLALPLNLEDYYFVNMDLARAISAAVVSYRNKARLYLACGGTQEHIFYTTVNPSLLALPSDDLPDHSIVTWAIRWVRAFEELATISQPFRMAAIHLAMALMRWQLDPSPATYAAVPSWLRPGSSQCFVPHLSIIEFIPWPKIRDALVQAPGYHAALFVKHISFHWPHTDENIFTVDTTTGMKDLSLTFKAHVEDLHNWTIRADMLLELPHLAGLA